ncbi:MAG: diguanylate cyclase, partial [Caldimonas sp.]
MLPWGEHRTLAALGGPARANFQDSQRLLPALAGFAISAVLLWLACEVFAVARARARPAARRLKGCAILLAGFGLWWPGHFLAPLDAIGDVLGVPFVGSVLAWLLAGFATLTAVAATRKTLPAFAGLAVVTLLVAYAHSVLATPGLFRATQAFGAWGPGLSVFVLATALVGLDLAFRPSRKLRVMRIGGALLCATLLTLAACVSGDAALPPAPAWAEALLVGALIGVAFVMLDALRNAASHDDEPARRTSSVVPTVDSLTQLPTRVYFEDRLAAAATKADAGSSRLALLFIDLDGFKPVNDTYGHSIGDLVLEQVGQRLKAMSRGKDVVARVGGDEFLLLLSNVSSQEAIAHVADRLIQGLSQPYAAEGREVMISCSVGIAMYPDGCSHAKLIARADAAMYASKRSGGSKHCFYSNAMDADAEAQFELLRDLRKAVVAKEFELFYQPKIDSKSGKVTAVEALLRWKHPTRGLLLPNTFIPIAERSGLIGAIGNWVIEDACRQSRQWREKGVRMRVAINLSAHQMRQDDIVERITDALNAHRIHPSLLTCEITESAAMEDTKTTQATFRRLGE